jgi:hypothetical protein
LWLGHGGMHRMVWEVRKSSFSKIYIKKLKWLAPTEHLYNMI